MPAQKPGRSKQDYGTPPELWSAVLDALGLESFDIDLAADAENAVPCEQFYTESDNALTQPSWECKNGWNNGWNWCNPPYSNITPWVKKAWEEWCANSVQTVMLLPAGVGSNWWRDWVHDKAYVLLLNGRITFVGASDPYPKDTVLLFYGMNGLNKPGYDVWDWQK